MANKLKSHKGARKRFKVTASGKVKHRRSFSGHLMSNKSGNRRRHLRRDGFVTPVFARKLLLILDV